MSTRDEYVESMKSSFTSIAVKLTITWVTGLVPWLANPFLTKLVELIASRLFAHLAGQTELAIFFKYIDTRVGKQSAEFEEAAMNNWRVQQNGTKAEKLEAEALLWSKFKTFASLKS